MDKRAKWIALAVGVAVLAGLLTSFDWRAVLTAALGVGWGVVVLVAYRFANLQLDAVGWSRLVDPSVRPAWPTVLRLRWIGESVNALVPVAQVGGDVVRGILLARHGVPGVKAAASVVVDFTAGLATQVMFTVFGAALLLATAAAGGLAGIAAATVVAVFLIAAVVFAVQRSGGFALIGRVVRRLTDGGAWATAAGGLESLDVAVRGLYARRAELAACAFWRLASWLAHAVEVWLIFRFMGKPIGWVDAVILESLGTALRSIVFFVPGALGIQEGGFLMIGLALGIGAPDALAMALIKRVRELLVGGPGLIAWAAAVRRPAPAPGEAPR